MLDNLTRPGMDDIAFTTEMEDIELDDMLILRSHGLPSSPLSKAESIEAWDQCLFDFVHADAFGEASTDAINDLFPTATPIDQGWKTAAAATVESPSPKQGASELPIATIVHDVPAQDCGPPLPELVSGVLGQPFPHGVTDRLLDTIETPRTEIAPETDARKQPSNERLDTLSNQATIGQEDTHRGTWPARTIVGGPRAGAAAPPHNSSIGKGDCAGSKPGLTHETTDQAEETADSGSRAVSPGPAAALSEQTPASAASSIVAGDPDHDISEDELVAHTPQAPTSTLSSDSTSALLRKRSAFKSPLPLMQATDPITVDDSDGDATLGSRSSMCTSEPSAQEAVTSPAPHLPAHRTKRRQFKKPNYIVHTDLEVSTRFHVLEEEWSKAERQLQVFREERKKFAEYIRGLGYEI
ncbi:MAG: hypothetical protein LQ350_008225 [Teloschistes chrysophthalmus]|nr:MAG: hypothetical protein LQ350_008225 [Niorma chrysophthalma]